MELPQAGWRPELRVMTQLVCPWEQSREETWTGLFLDEEVYDWDTKAGPVVLQGRGWWLPGARPERRGRGGAEGAGDVMMLSRVFLSRGCCWVRAPWPRQAAGQRIQGLRTK